MTELEGHAHCEGDADQVEAKEPRAGGPANLRVDGAVLFTFGLVHGLGLSTRLQDLGLPYDGLAVRVLLFNVGVEIGQLTAIAVIVGLGA